MPVVRRWWLPPAPTRTTEADRTSPAGLGPKAGPEAAPAACHGFTSARQPRPTCVPPPSRGPPAPATTGSTSIERRRPQDLRGTPAAWMLGTRPPSLCAASLPPGALRPLENPQGFHREAGAVLRAGSLMLGWAALCEDLHFVFERFVCKLLIGRFSSLFLRNNLCRLFCIKRT